MKEIIPIKHGFWLIPLDYTDDKGKPVRHWVWGRMLGGARISSWNLKLKGEQYANGTRYKTKQQAAAEAYKWWRRAVAECGEEGKK